MLSLSISNYLKNMQEQSGENINCMNKYQLFGSHGQLNPLANLQVLLLFSRAVISTSLQPHGL